MTYNQSEQHLQAGRSPFLKFGPDREGTSHNRHYLVHVEADSVLNSS